MKSDQKSFLDICELGVLVETNVPQGGDAGHGGKTRITLTDQDGFAFGDAHGTAPGTTVELEVLGDAEAQLLADALTWAGERLRALIDE